MVVYEDIKIYFSDVKTLHFLQKYNGTTGFIAY